MRKRRQSKVDGRTLRAKHTFKTLECSECSNEVRVDKDTTAVICWECTQKKAPVDPKLLQPLTKKIVKKENGFPRGWHLYKLFVHPDGRVFEKGVENTKLKGTLPPTKVKVNTLTRGQRRRLREEKQAKREARLARKHKKKMELLKKEESL